MTLECPSGVMIVGEKLEFGLINVKSKYYGHCTEDSFG
jgi:hypothetical protein